MVRKDTAHMTIARLSDRVCQTVPGVKRITQNPHHCRPLDAAQALLTYFEELANTTLRKGSVWLEQPSEHLLLSFVACPCTMSTELTSVNTQNGQPLKISGRCFLSEKQLLVDPQCCKQTQSKHGDKDCHKSHMYVCDCSHHMRWKLCTLLTSNRVLDEM